MYIKNCINEVLYIKNIDVWIGKRMDKWIDKFRNKRQNE